MQILVDTDQGQLVLGMTSEGGGAVAFPVMTLALGIKPSVARDFSLMIQSCGMMMLSTHFLFYHSEENNLVLPL